MNQVYTDINEINNKEIEKNKDKIRIKKAINLIDDFVTKFVSKIEYFKLNLESQLNQPQLTLINNPLLISNDNLKEKNQEKENIYTNLKYKLNFICFFK